MQVFASSKLGPELKKFSALHEEVPDDRPEGQRGEKIERANQKHGSEKQNQKCAAGDWKRADAWRSNFLLHQRSRQRHYWHDHEESAEQHVETKRCVIGRRVAGETGERAAVVARAGTKCVKNLAQSVRAIV